MTTADIRLDVISIINEVERKLGISESTTLTTRTFTTVLLDFLNDSIDEINDYGEWAQMFREVDVTASSSVESYEISVSSNVHHVYEIHFDDDVSPLFNRSVEDLRRLQKTRGTGVPRQFSITDVSGVNPRFRVYPIPGPNENGKLFDIAFYKKQRLFTTVTADSTAIPAWPSRMLVAGTYAKALLEEAGQEPTRQSERAERTYTLMRNSAYNRFKANTGTDVFIVPMGGRY